MMILGKLFFVAFGLGCWILSVLHFRTHARSKGWKSTDGEILLFDTRSNANPQLAYKYSVDGQNYTGLNDSPIGPPMYHKSAKGPLVCYRPGQLVEVFYNPDKHCEAALYREPLYTGLVWLLFGAPFIIGGVLAPY